MIRRLRRFLFTNQNTRQTIAKNAFWLATSTTLIKLLRAAIIIYAARLLGTNQYGIFTYAMGLAALFTIFSDIGLTNILTRELAGDGDRREYLSTALAIKVALLFVAIILIMFVGPSIAHFDEAKSLLGIIALSVSFESLRSFLYAITRAQNKMQAEAALNVISEIVCTLFVLGIFFHHPSAHSLALAYMIGNGVSFLITATALNRHLVDAARFVRRSLIAPIIRTALPFAIMGIFGVFMSNVDTVIIGIFGTPQTLGWYAVAQRPISLLYVVPGFLSVSFFTIISRLSKEGKREQLSRLIGKATALSLGLALPLAVGGIITAAPLIRLVFGAPYAGSTLTFQILLLTLPVVFSGAVLSDVILAEDRQKLFIKSSAFGALINVGLDLILIPKIGIAGSAIATVIAQTVMTFIWLGALRKTHGTRLMRGTGKIIVATIGMGAVAFALTVSGVSVLITLGISVVTYGALLIVLRDPLVLEFRRLFQRRPIVEEAVAD